MRLAIEPKILYFGTPVVLISTQNEDETPNLAPMSSAWALGWNILLGLGTSGKTFENLTRTKECVLNFPSDDLWSSVEALAPLTGKNPIPAHKRAAFRYEKDKFRAASLTPIASEIVKPPAVKECPLQLEAQLVNAFPIGADNDICGIEVRIVRVYAHPEIVTGTHYINPSAWKPLIYSFRHYFGLSKELGQSFRSET